MNTDTSMTNSMRYAAVVVVTEWLGGCIRLDHKKFCFSKAICNYVFQTSNFLNENYMIKEFPHQPFLFQ